MSSSNAHTTCDSEKERLLRETGRRCIYCGVPLSPRSMTIDHIIPKARGGSDCFSNKTCACPRCNNEKADMTLRQFMSTRRPGSVSRFIERVESAHEDGLIEEDKFLRLAGKKEKDELGPLFYKVFHWKPTRRVSLSLSVRIARRAG